MALDSIQPATFPISGSSKLSHPTRSFLDLLQLVKVLSRDGRYQTIDEGLLDSWLINWPLKLLFFGFSFFQLPRSSRKRLYLLAEKAEQRLRFQNAFQNTLVR